ncbi:MAG TPA: peptide ABC transporter substrate-binding protein [Candidatus Eremiobacteraceae bacterium]|nr:peptide ABC transporter substrate-binding protein [Candidatus Eremiobacteraceae bacterium]
MKFSRLALLAAALAAAAGCSSSTPSGNASSTSAKPPQHVLRLVTVGDIDGLNPLLRTQALGTDVDLLVYGYFFELDDKMRYVPDLATEVPSRENGGISADGLTLTYHLRKGVKWQDNVPFTARDVVFTANAIIKAGNAISSPTGWDDISSVEAVGDDEVRFHLKKLYAPAISTFFCESGLYPVLPAHVLDKYSDITRAPFDHPIGTGPFKLVRWTRGQSIELQANPSYWRGRPKLDGVEYFVAPTDDAAVSILTDGNADGWLRAPSALFDRLKGLRGFHVDSAPSLSYTHLDLNQENRVLDDANVRKAIALTIDRDELVSKVGGAGADPAWTDVSPLSWAYDKGKQPKPDPARARELLRSAGWLPGPGNTLRKGGQTLAFDLSTASDSPGAKAIEAQLQQELRGVGIETTTKDYPSGQLLAPYGTGGIVFSGKYDAALFSWTAGADPDDSAEYLCDQTPPKGQNDMYWCDDKLDAAERGALSTYDRTVRKRYYSVIQNELTTQAATIVLYFERQAFVTPADMRGFAPAPSTSNNWNSWEWSI